MSFIEQGLFLLGMTPQGVARMRQKSDAATAAQVAQPFGPAPAA